ncbi:MAG: hypothetical protein ABW168_08135, partial [Sedimenticola sp.]
MSKGYVTCCDKASLKSASTATSQAKTSTIYSPLPGQSESTLAAKSGVLTTGKTGASKSSLFSLFSSKAGAAKTTTAGVKGAGTAAAKSSAKVAATTKTGATA